MTLQIVKRFDDRPGERTYVFHFYLWDCIQSVAVRFMPDELDATGRRSIAHRLRELRKQAYERKPR